MLLCAPALRALRRRFPDAPLHFLVASEFRQAAELLPGIDKIIEFDRNSGWRGLLRLRRLLSRRYELIVDLQNSWRSTFLRVFCFPLMWTKAVRYRLRRWLLIRFKWNTYGATKPVALRYLEAVKTVGGDDDGAGLDLIVPEPENQVAKANLIVLCPGAKHATKRWPIENWIHVAEQLKRDGLEIAVCGTQGEAEECRRIGEAGAAVILDAPLKEIGTLMRSSAGVITHDSGLMHLAAGSGAPVLAIFGPTVEAFGFYPFRAQSVVLENSVSCRPCTAFGGETCPKGHHDCMKLTTHEQVITTLSTLMDQRRHIG